MSFHMDYQIKEYVVEEQNINPTGKIVLLGTAVDGPVLSPTPIRDSAYAQRIFGDPEESMLTKGAQQAFLSNVDEIILMRISGKEAENTLYGLTKNDQVIDAIKLKSIFGGEKYNEIVIRVKSDAVIFDFGEESALEQKVYSYNQYPTLGLLSDAINQDCKTGKNLIYTLTNYRTMPSKSLAIINDEEVNLYGGQDEIDLTKNDIYLQLEEAYAMLDDYPAEIFVPLGVYLDDTYPHAYYGITPYEEGWYSNTSNLDENKYLTLVKDNGSPCNFAEQLISFCINRQERGFKALGIIGMKPFRETSVSLRDHEYSHINKLLTNPIIQNSLVGFSSNKIIKNRYLLSVVASEAAGSYGQYSYQDNAAVNYAVLISQLAPDISPTNKTIEGITLPYEFTQKELDQLVDLKYVILRESVRHGIVPHNAVTMADKDSGLQYITSVRILQSIISEIQIATEKLTGEPIWTTGNYDLIEETVEKLLQKYKDEDFIRDCSFDMSANWQEGLIEIKLNILPYYEVNKISTQVRFNIN